MKQTCHVQHSQLSLRVRSEIWQHTVGSARHHVILNATVNDRKTRYFSTIFGRFRKIGEK
jgi:hypothetical protein